MPTLGGSELHTVDERGRKTDEKLHEELMHGGHHERARHGKLVARRHGLSEQQAKLLYDNHEE